MLSLCIIWSETGRRVVLDGGVGVGFLPTVMAAGVLRAGALEGGGEVVEELQGDVAKLQKDTHLFLSFFLLCYGWS
jgi:hypothetical protein